MQYSFTSVPFKTDSGMSQINGVAKFSSAGVVLEFESKLFGLIFWVPFFGMAVGAGDEARRLACVPADGLHVLLDVHETCPALLKA